MDDKIADILTDIKIGAIDSARSVAVNMLEVAAKDALRVITFAEPKLVEYITSLLSKRITENQFINEVKGLLQCVELTGITELGMAKIEVDKTRNAIIKTVTSIAIGAVSKIV